MKFLKIMLFLLVIIVSEQSVFAVDNEGSVLGTEFQVNTYTASDQQYPSVASDGENYFVTWMSYGQDGDGSGVYGQLFDNEGNLIGAEFQVNTYITDWQINSSVASNGANYLVTWMSYGQDGDGSGVYGQIFDNEGNLIGAEFQVNTYTAGGQDSPSVATDGTNYLVTWMSNGQDGDVWDIYGQVFDNEGNPIGAEFQVNTYITDRQDSPSIASDGENYLVTWMSNGQDGGVWDIYGQVFDNEGNPIGAEFQVNTYTTNDQSESLVASNGANYLVTWMSNGQDGDSGGIYGQIFDNEGNPIGAEFQVNTYITDGQVNSSVASNGTNYLVTWMSHEQDGDVWGVYGQLLDDAGDKIGTEFQVNTYTTSQQILPSITSNGTNYLLTWMSNGQDGDGMGVYAKTLTYSALSIFEQPSSKTVYLGEDASFTIGAISEGDLHYQWYKNSVMVGTDSDTLSLTDVQLSDNDSIITCVVSADNDSVTSAEALLTVLVPVTITQQPQSQSTYVGESVTFSIGVTAGTGALHYQWYKNDVAVGSDSNELTIQNPQISDNDSIIYCDVSDTLSTVQSDSVTLSVLEDNTLGTEFQVNTYTANDQEYPFVASNGANYLITWESYGQDGSSEGIYGQLLDNGGNKIGTEFQANTYTSNNQKNPSVISDGENYFITWMSYGQDGNNYEVHGQLFNNTGSKIGSEFKINTYTPRDQGNSSIISNGANYLVTWNSYRQDGSGYGVYGQIFDNDGTKIGLEFQVNTYTVGDQHSSSVVSDGENYLVTWMSDGQDGDGKGAYGQLLDNDGTKIGSEFQVNTYTTGDQWGAKVVSDGTNYLTIWSSNGQDGGGYGVYGQLLDNDGTKIGSEFQVNTYTTGDQWCTKVASNGENYFITWKSVGQDGSAHGVYGQLLDNAGNKVGSEFRVNTYTLNNQWNATVASDGENYLVTWSSNGQDGSGYGVYAKILTDPLIFEQPLSRTVYIGEDASFTIGAISEGDLHYQWYKNSVMVGTDSDTLSLTDVQLSDNDSIITCVVSADNDSVTSAEALLTVLAPVTIIQQPQSRSSYVGESVTFSVSADTEAGTLHYQWYKNDVAVGVDSNELTIQNTQLSDNDSIIYCVVSNYCSTVQSDSVTLNVFYPITYGTEFQVNTYISSDQSYPSVASDGENYLVTWRSQYQGGSGTGVYGQLLDNEGINIGLEFQVNTHIMGDQSSPSLSSDGENYLVTWTSNGQDGSGLGLFAQLLDNEGTKIGLEFQVNTYVIADQWGSSVSSDGENYLVTWTSQYQDGDGTGVYGQLFDNEGTKVGLEFQVNTYVIANQWGSSVATDGTNYLVSWTSEGQDGDRSGVYAQILDNEGTKIGSEFQVNTYVANSQEGPSVTSNGTDYLVSWYSIGQDGSGSGVYAQILDNAGTKIGSEFLVNTYTLNEQNSPSVVSDGTDYLIAWHSSDQDGDGAGVYAQIFDDEGNLVGSESQVNTYVSNSQSYPSSSSNGMNYLVTWMSNAQDGDGQGIYAKIFNYSVLTIFDQPSSKTVYIGEDASFTIGAIGAGDLHYQWYKDTVTVGTSSNTLTLTDLQLSDNDSIITCVVSDGDNDSVTSAEALLTVSSPIIFTQQPQSKTVYVGEDVTFSIGVTAGAGALHYQWHKNGVIIGSDSNELTIQNPQLSDNDSTIYCEVSDIFSTVQSDSAMLNVITPSFEIIIYGSETMEENDTSFYTAHAIYGLDEYIVTNYVVWSILEFDNCAEIDATGKLTTYHVDEDRTITIRATLTDLGETHWSDFSVTINNLFKVVDMNPIANSIITHAPYQIVITFNENIDNDTVSDATCYLLKAGDDKQFGTSDDSLIPLFASLLDFLNISLDVSDTLLPNDIYRVKLSGIKNLDGDFLDGEFSGLFPSGDGSSGGVFLADFTVSRQIISVILDNDGLDSIEWASFRDNLLYRVESTDSLEFPDWQPLEPVSQWPIAETIYAWDIPDNDTQMFFRVVGVMPYIDTVNPSFGEQGTFSLDVEIVGYGTDWSQENITVTFGDGITVNSIDVSDGSHITVAIRISFSSDLGYRDIIVTNGSDVYIKENGFEVVE